ncbi:MAG: hypothetical protein HDS50_04375 [Bacteroides sp.]|nr:hypothetical protein [Bacteroides sp.]
MTLNQQLMELYASKLKDLPNLFSELNSSFDKRDHNFSWPLLIRIWEEEYLSAPVKVMFFGQEATGWNNQTNNKIEENDEESLTEEYLIHNMGRDKMSSAFIRTMHSLNIRLGNPDTNCFVYNNILKFAKEDGHGYPSDKVMDAEMRYLNVIQDEVDILKPEVCVFLTGVNYDSDIEKKFNGVELLPVPGFEKNWLAQIKHPHLPQKSFRTYHPGRIMNSEDRIIYDKVLDKIIELSK